MNRPQVSVILPVHNAEEFVGKALESLLEHGIDDMEIIVINDGSTDRTNDVIRSFRDSRIQVLTQTPRQGVAPSLNAGVRLSRGEFIARIDADDEILRGRIQTQVSFMQSHPEVCAVGMGRLVHRGGRYVELPPVHVGSNIGAWLVEGNILVHPSVMMRRSSLEGVQGPYNPRYKVAQDYRLWVDLAARGFIGNMAGPGIVYREHPNQISARKLKSQSAASLRIRLVAIWKLRHQLQRCHWRASALGFARDLWVIMRP